MSNPLVTIGHGLKVGAEDIAKGVAYPITSLIKAEKVIASAIKDQPEVRAAVTSLVEKAQAVIGDTVGVAASKGINLAADASTLADAEAFFVYFRDSFIPVVAEVYMEIKDDVAS